MSGAYASLTQDGGIALYAPAESLRILADAITAGAAANIPLTAPPAEVLEKGPLRMIRLLAGEAGPVNLRVVGETIDIVGGADARAKLAASLRNLASTPAFGGEVPRHLDLEYFPGHSFLGDASTWMTVTLLPVLNP
jgi:hypothetical protein